MVLCLVTRRYKTITGAHQPPPPSPAKVVVGGVRGGMAVGLMLLAQYNVWVPVRGSARDDYEFDVVAHAQLKFPPTALEFW